MKVSMERFGLGEICGVSVNIPLAITQTVCCGHAALLSHADRRMAAYACLSMAQPP